MAGIRIPRDRTGKQCPRGYCVNPECLKTSDSERFEFDLDHDLLSCPKCGANESPLVGLVALVHHIIKHPQGRIVGVGGLRYGLGCDPSRAFIATQTNNECGTGHIEHVNCPGCLAAYDKTKTPAITGTLVKI